MCTVIAMNTYQKPKLFGLLNEFTIILIHNMKFMR